MRRLPDADEIDEDDFLHRGEERRGRTPLSGVREGATLRGQVVAQIYHHGLQVCGGSVVVRVCVYACCAWWVPNRGTPVGQSCPACWPSPALLRRLALPSPATTTSRTPPPRPQIDVGAEFDGLLPIAEEQWEALYASPQLCAAIDVGATLEVVVHRVRDPRLFRFPVQVRGQQGGRARAAAPALFASMLAGTRPSGRLSHAADGLIV